MSDSAAFVLTMSVVIIGMLIFFAIRYLADVIRDKKVVIINNYGLAKTETDDSIAYRFNGKQWERVGINSND